jgi:hypothetical protein
VLNISFLPLSADRFFFPIPIFPVCPPEFDPACNWQLATGNWQLATGCWLLAAGYWLLATGYWLLATGNWQLATGYWLLAVARQIVSWG